MLESVGPLGDVMRKLNQVPGSGDTSQVRFEVIEIIEALILALVAVATAWSGYQAARLRGGSVRLWFRQADIDDGNALHGYAPDDMAELGHPPARRHR